MSLIIVEGSEGTGKSTLCKNLSININAPVVKMKVDKKIFKNNIEDVSKVFNTTLLQLKPIFINNHVILDRGFLSSLIYSDIYKRKYNLKYIYKILKELKDVLKIIILVADNNVLKKRRLKDKYVDSSLYEKINNTYIKYAKMLKTNYHLDILLIDTSKKKKQETLNTCLYFLAQR